MSLHGARRLGSAALGVALVTGSAVALAGSAQADPNANITICHATASATNPFVVNTVDAASIVKTNGHDQHQDRRDVIPPFTYIAENGGAEVSYPGLNWDDNWETNGEGVALEEVDEADCVPGDETTPPGTTTPPATTPPATTPPATTPPATTPPTGPVVETDVVHSDVMPAAIGGALALLLAAGAGATLVARRRGTHA